MTCVYSQSIAHVIHWHSSKPKLLPNIYTIESGNSRKIHKNGFKSRDTITVILFKFLSFSTHCGSFDLLQLPWRMDNITHNLYLLTCAYVKNLRTWRPSGYSHNIPDVFQILSMVNHQNLLVLLPNLSEKRTVENLTCIPSRYHRCGTLLSRT